MCVLYVSRPNGKKLGTEETTVATFFLSVIRKKLRHVHSLCRSGPASRVLVVRDRQSSARTKLVFSILASNRDEYKLRPTARAAFWSDHSKGTCSIIIKQTRKQNMSMRGGICGTAGRGLVCRTVATLYCFPKKKKKAMLLSAFVTLKATLTNLWDVEAQTPDNASSPSRGFLVTQALCAGTFVLLFPPNSNHCRSVCQ